MDKPRMKQSRKSLPARYPIRTRNQLVVQEEMGSEHTAVPYEVIKQQVLTEIITVKCSYCCKIFDSIEMHKQHHCKRLKDFLQLCPNCNMSYIEHQLNNKPTTSTSECENQSSVPVDNADKPQLTYACCVCKKTFPDLFTAVRHIKYHVTSISRKGEFAVHCGECGKGFPTKQQLIKHETVHSDVRPFKCDVCDKWFKTPDNVKRHMIVHNDVKPFSCTTCGKNFKSKQMMRKHMEIHTDQRVYECPKCDKKYKAKNSLRDHLRVHSGQRPYKCQQCDQAFYRPSHLATHKVVHSNVKPFACKDCDKKFGRKEHLKVHERIHSGEKPFKCKLCDRAFNQQAGLQAHMVSHSEERPHACPKCNKAFKYPSQIKHHACKPELRPSMVFDSNIVDTCGSQETFADPGGEATTDVSDASNVRDPIRNDQGVCLNPSETIILIQIQNDHQHMQSVLDAEQRFPGTSQLIGNSTGTQVNMGNMMTHSAGSTGISYN